MDNRGGVPYLHQKQTVGRCLRSGVLAVFSQNNPFKIGNGLLSRSHVQQGTYQRAHHAAQKPIGLYAEHQGTPFLPPLGGGDGT